MAFFMAFGWCLPSVPLWVEEFTEANSLVGLLTDRNQQLCAGQTHTKECDKPGITGYGSESTQSSRKCKTQVEESSELRTIIISFLYSAYVYSKDLNCLIKHFVFISLCISFSLCFFFFCLCLSSSLIWLYRIKRWKQLREREILDR